MSDKNFTDADWEQAEQVANQRETYIGVWSWNGTQLPLETNAPSVGELEDIEARLNDAGQEEEVMEEIVGEYLVRPEKNPKEMDAPKLGALFAGMQVAWSDAVDTSEVEEKLPLEGNR